MSTDRTRVKICGITNADDARAAVEFGADALGFILVAGSPRCIDVNTAFQLGCGIPPFVSKVAVISDWADKLDAFPKGFDAFQYYTNLRGFRMAEGMPGYSRTRRIRAYRIRSNENLDEVAETCNEAQAILLDAYHPDKLGGSGETFNWDLATVAKQQFKLPIILAGGLTPENVGDAIQQVRPYAVDVSSGVESSPGRKDHAKLKAFIEAVRAADQ